MNRSKSPPVNLEKYLEGKRHRFCTYAQGARLYAMAYWSFVNMAKQAGANIKLRKTALVKLRFSGDFYASYDKVGMVVVMVVMALTAIGCFVRDRL